MSNSTTKPSGKRILIVEPDTVLRNVLRSFLARDHHVDTASTAGDAMEFLHNSAPYDLALAEVNLASGTGAGIDFLADATVHQPDLVPALITGVRIDDHFARLAPAGIRNVLVRTIPFDYIDFALAVENLLFPEKCMGLKRYMTEPFELQSGRIRSLDTRRNVVEDAMRFFRNYRRYDTDINSTRLALEEIINNAVFHAFRLKDGSEKYRAGEFTHLDPGEEVLVEFGRDTRQLGFSVTDNQGTLNPSVAMQKVERQISLDGLYDLNGRGIYLSRNLSDRMILNLHPGVASQVILLFRHRPVAHPRPLHINVIPRSDA